MGKCKNCINLDRQGWCEKAIDSPEPNRERECYYFQRMTNADRIRVMTDEELAEWIHPYAVENFPEKYCNEGCKEDNVDCIGCLLHWLKKEVEE